MNGALPERGAQDHLDRERRKRVYEGTQCVLFAMIVHKRPRCEAEWLAGTSVLLFCERRWTTPKASQKVTRNWASSPFSP